jgi:glycosyltransferase involved in cell wall biosynthesis
MHLAISTTSLRVGGAERVAVNLSTGLVERGHDVDLVLVSAEGQLLGELHGGVNVVDLSARRVLTGVPPLHRYLRRSDPDLLYSMMPHNNVAAAIALTMNDDIPFVPSVHNMPSSEIGSTKDVLLFLAARAVYANADHCVTVSEGVRNDLVRTTGLSREDITVIYNPIVSDRLKRQASRNPDHPWFDEADVILGAGRHIEQKGFETLLRAFAIAQENVSQELRLIITGHGPKTDEYRRLADSLGIAEDIDFPGFVDNIYAYLASGDLFVLPSRWEGFGNILVEAMACGTQVVATDCQSGPAEILEEGAYGRLVPVDDVHGLADAIVAQLEGDRSFDVRKRASAFEIDTVAEAYEDLFADLVERKPRNR